MKERPILFSAPMVRAILDGRKTQTRRVVKPVRGFERHNLCKPDMAADRWAVWWHGEETDRVGCFHALVTASLEVGDHREDVRAFLVAYYGNEKEGATLFDPMRTVTSKERFGLVTVAGTEYVIADIGMRMLAPRELFRAQGFPDSYKIDIPFNGKPLTKTAQVRMCGNSVCPPMAAAIVGANYTEEVMEVAA